MLAPCEVIPSSRLSPTLAYLLPQIITFPKAMPHKQSYGTATQLLWDSRIRSHCLQVASLLGEGEIPDHGSSISPRTLWIIHPSFLSYHQKCKSFHLSSLMFYSLNGLCPLPFLQSHLITPPQISMTNSLSLTRFFLSLGARLKYHFL